MPYLSGLEVIQMIRLKDKDVKIIISTAHAEEEKLLQAIPLGLSSYLKKPVKERELRDVLRSVIYELEQKTNNILKFSQTFYWDTQENILYNNLNKIHLTRNELTLMQILSSQPSLHLSLDDILEKFWQYQSQKDMTENSVRNIIKRLKQKLPIDTIENYYGVGYKLCTTK